MSNVQAPVVQKNATVVSSSKSANIVCHRCKGMGHVMKDCPSRRAYIATPDGGYVSASDVEGELALATNLLVENVEEEAIDSVAAATAYESLLVQHVLST